MRTITDFEMVRLIVQAKEFEPFPIGDTYRRIIDRLGLDLDAATRVLDRLPTFMGGPEHKQVRADMARQMGGRRNEQVAAAQAFLAEFGRTALVPDTRLDLLMDLSRPLFRAIKKATLPAYADHDELFDLIEQIPLLLAPATPLRRRMAISKSIAAFTEEFGEEAINDLTLLALGQGPLTGSLTTSLHALVARNPDTALRDIAWPAKLAESVLTFIDRVCATPTTIGGETFAAGDYVRCMIQPPDWSEQEIEVMKFGVGSHLCIGRPLSEIVWSLVAGTLAQSELVATAGPIEMRFGKEPFHMPARAEITLRTPGLS